MSESPRSRRIDWHDESSHADVRAIGLLAALALAGMIVTLIIT